MNLEIKLEPKFVPDEETAIMALKLVELYVNDKCKSICVDTNDDGTVSYRFGDNYYYNEVLCRW